MAGSQKSKEDTIRTIVKKKLYNGNVELRHYEVEKYVRLGQPIKIVVGNEYMILSVARLKQGKVVNTQYSIYNQGQTYKLIGFEWHGTPYKDESVEISTDARLKLKEVWESLYGKKA